MTLSTRTLRAKVVVAGIGETTYYKHGKSPDPEFRLALLAILRACEDAGIGPREIDGFASYSNDRNDPSRLAAALGLPELRFSNMQWGGAEEGARPPSPMPRRPWPPASRIASWSSARWPRASSRASAWAPRRPPYLVSPPSPFPTG